MTAKQNTSAGGFTFRGELREEDHAVLSPQAQSFLRELVLTFRPRVDELLERRKVVQARYDAGERPAFLASTAEVRRAEWTVSPLPQDLLDRRVEITGPVDRKMIVNALNSGARVFMADFEDATSPTWRNLLEGQANLEDAVRRRIDFDDPRSGKRYALADKTATLLVRPRGWHLWERHVELEGRAVPGALFDFGLYFFHNARELLARGTGPYFYLPKLQSHLEARLWNDVFVAAQGALGVPRGSIKATVLIETLPAAFEMDEILYELREHSSGLNCGRWDYMFSFIKTLKADPACVLPDRGAVTMEQHFLRSYTELLIQTCHRRRVHAMGGMAAQIPIKSDPVANAAALDKVKADKLREVKAGHDGTWVAHPGLVAIATQVFDEYMRGPHQLDNARPDVKVTAHDLLTVPNGPRTERGLLHNVDVGVRYLAAWLSGSGCVPIYNLMEDAATAEISRTQIWQWVKHRVRLDDGRTVTPELVEGLAAQVVAKLGAEAGELYDQATLSEARTLFAKVSTAATFEEFLTVPAYERLIEKHEDGK